MFNALTLKRYFEWISLWSMTALFALLPVFFVPLPWVTLSEGKMLLVVGLLFLSLMGWGVSALLNGGIRIPRSTTLFAAVLLPVAYFVSTITSGMSSVSIVGGGVEQDTLAAVCIWYLALAGAAIIFSDMLTKGIYAIRALFMGVFFVDVIELLHLLVPSFGSFGGVLATQTSNLLGGWYELGVLAGLFLFLSLALISTPVAHRWWKYLLFAVGGLSFVFLVIIHTRDIWLALAIITFVLVAIDVLAGKHLYSMRHLRAWRPYGAAMGVCIMAILFAIFGGFVHSHLPGSIQISMTEVRPSWQGTLQIGSHTLSQPSQLAFGAGPNTFMREWVLYKPVEVNQTLFWNTDFNSGVGSIPTSLVTIGVFGGIAWIVLIVSILWAMLRLAHSGPRPGASMIIEPLFLGGLFLLAFHIFYVPGPALSVLTFLLLGLAIGYAASLGRMSILFLDTTRRTIVSRASLVALIVFMLITAASTLGIFRVLVAEMLINQSVTVYNSSGDLARSSGLIAEALRIYPDNARGQRAAVELGILQIQTLASATPNEQTASQLKHAVESTIQYGLGAVSANEDDYQNWLELANLYQQLAGANVAGAYENAESAYAKLIARNPTNPLPYLGRARLEVLQKNNTAALEDLAAALRLKPDFAAAFYLASQIYGSQNDFANALPAAATAAKYAPNDPLAWYNLGVIAYSAADYTDAALALERSLTLEPRYANALYALGLTYYQLGRLNDAIVAFQQLDVLNPHQSSVTQILSNLKNGNPPLQQSTTKMLPPVKK